MEFHGSTRNVISLEHYILCANMNIIPNKNKIFMGKIKENQIGKDIAFEKMIQHADRLSNK